MELDTQIFEFQREFNQKLMMLISGLSDRIKRLEEGRKTSEGRELSEEHKRSIPKSLKGKECSEERKNQSLVDESYKPRGIYKSGFREDLGHECRSSWEANVCRVLRYRGIEYEYEKHRFDLGDTRYTPDLYIPSKDMYIEIKGYWRPGNIEKCCKFTLLGYNLKIIDRKKYREWEKRYRDKIPHWDDEGIDMTEEVYYLTS